MMHLPLVTFPTILALLIANDQMARLMVAPLASEVTSLTYNAVKV